MKTFTSLQEMEKLIGASASTGGSKKYFSLKDGDSFKIRFRQELTEDSSNHDAEAGTAVTTNVVTSVINWKWKIASTASSESNGYRCWGTEQAAANGRWRPRPHLLINIGVEVEPGNWEARVIDTTFNQRHIGLTLIEYAKEFGTIVDRYYKYARTGSGASDTNYTLIPLEIADEPAGVTELPFHDLDSMYMTLPYSEQEQFLTTGERSNAPVSDW